MAIVRSSHCLLLLFSCLVILPSSAFYCNSIYNLGDGDSATSSAVDYIAADNNLPPPQPYNQLLGTDDYKSGLNFATPGATIMSPLFFLKNGIPPPPHSHDLSQIETFIKFFYKNCTSFHDCGKNKTVKEAFIFMDQPGISDYKHAFLHGKSISEVSLLVPEVVETIINSVERLIVDAGAEVIMVSGSLPMGCFPGFRTMFPQEDSTSQNETCHEGLNMLSKLHHHLLWRAIEDLRSKYREAEIIYADYYDSFRFLLRTYLLMGFKEENLMKACCGSGTGPFNFDAQKKCGDEGVVACTDRASYIHWDGFRLTPEAVKNLIDTVDGKNDKILGKEE